MALEAEHLASVLDEAKRTRAPLDASTPPWADLDAELAADIGAAFCRLIGADQSPYWKLGAIDEATQARLGLSGPVFAPLDPECVQREAVTVTLDRSLLISPRFEPEIGVARVDGVLLATPCVEIADSRFAGWRLPPWGVVADAGLQGHMLFGPAVVPRDEIDVVVRFDGLEVGRGSGAWTDAIARLDLLPAGTDAACVATGALTTLFDCEPGVWTFDFGPVGELTVSVV